MSTMNKRGFTLIEMMIVIAIIGLLAAIVVPVFSENRSFRQEMSRKNSHELIMVAHSLLNAIDGNFEQNNIVEAMKGIRDLRVCVSFLGTRCNND